MSWYTQRHANKFPRWSKIRRDPSSLGQRLLSIWGMADEESAISSQWLSKEWHILNPRLGNPYLWRVVLNEDDTFPLATTDGGGRKYSDPATVEGTIGVDTYTLTRYDTLQDMLSVAPDRLTVERTVPYSNTIAYQNGVFNDIDWPERLAVVVSGSTDYKVKTARTNRLESGHHQVVIRGWDENDLPLEEQVDIVDDGIWWTKNWFKDELTDVWTEGFDGDVTIYSVPCGLDYVLDPFHPLVLPDLEGPLHLRLVPGADAYSAYTFVSLETVAIKAGDLYRNGQDGIPDNNVDLGQITLLDAGGLPFVGVDLAVSPENAKLYVIGDDGMLHVFSHTLPTFQILALGQDTVETYLELHPLSHYVALGDQSKVFTYFARIRYPILNVEIKRRSPDGTIRYLTSSKTWSSVQQTIPGRSVPDFAETWIDFAFDTVYDQPGQWEYSCTVETTADQTVYTTAVMVATWEADVSIDTGIANPVGCFFGHDGRLAVVDATDITYFNQWIDGWVPDYQQGQIILASEYDSVDVTY